MLGLLIYCPPSSPSFISKFRFLKPVTQDCLFLKTRNKTSPVCLAARQTLFSPVPRGGLGRRGGACKAGGGAAHRVLPLSEHPGGPLQCTSRAQVARGPPGAPRPRSRRTVPGPGWPGGAFLGPRAARGGCRGVWWCHHLPPPPIRVRPEPRDLPPVGLGVCLEFEWSNQIGLTGV